MRSGISIILIKQTRCIEIWLQKNSICSSIWLRSSNRCSTQINNCIRSYNSNQQFRAKTYGKSYHISHIYWDKIVSKIHIWVHIKAHSRCPHRWGGKSLAKLQIMNALMIFIEHLMSLHEKDSLREYCRTDAIASIKCFKIFGPFPTYFNIIIRIIGRWLMHQLFNYNSKYNKKFKTNIVIIIKDFNEAIQKDCDG